MEISFYIYYDYARRAGVAQLVEHLIRNEGVVGSSPITGTRIKNRDFYRGFYFIVYAGGNFFAPRGPPAGTLQVFYQQTLFCV